MNNVGELIADLKIENFKLKSEVNHNKKIIDRLSRKIQRLKKWSLKPRTNEVLLMNESTYWNIINDYRKAKQRIKELENVITTNHFNLANPTIKEYENHILKHRISKVLKLIHDNPIISKYEDNADLILEIEKELSGDPNV